MAEFDDLLAGIRAFPADELRRLVFADWLDENAHRNLVYAPWASYIRWAVAADRTPRTDPDYWKYRRYPESPPPGVAKLLGADGLPVRPEWTGGFPDVLLLGQDTLRVHDRKIASTLGPIRRVTVLGVPSSAVLAGRTVARTGELCLAAGDPGDLALIASGLRPSLKLRLKASAVEVVAAFAGLAFPTLAGLSVEDLTDPRAVAVAPSLPQLVSFDLTVADVANGIDALPPRLPNLVSLRLDRTGRDDFLPFLADGSSPRLVGLACPPPDAGTPGWAEFVASPAFTRLERLAWHSGGPNTADPIWPDSLPEPDAGELILNATRLGPGRTYSLAATPMLHRCACLFADHCEWTPDAYVALAENPSARNLKVLSIQMPFKSEPVASGAPLAALCRSPHLAGLTELSLTFHSLTDDDFGELLNATFADNLRYLNLAGSYFSERMLARLLDPDVMPELTWLDIHGPKEPNHPLAAAFRERFGPNFAF